MDRRAEKPKNIVKRVENNDSRQKAVHATNPEQQRQLDIQKAHQEILQAKNELVAAIHELSLAIKGVKA